jgi:broad specificity phosphatase PhoE
MILYLVRHGESVFNLERRIQGQLNVELSSLGHRQSLALAEALKSQPIEALYCSPLRRAMETAQPIAHQLCLEIKTDDRLKEINAGIFQGLHWDEIERLHPVEAVRWRTQEPDFVIPGGESRRALMERARACFDSIRETGLRQVLIVAHGGTLAGALKSLLSVPAELNPFSFCNASISRLAWEKQVKVLSINEIEHLRAIELTTDISTGDL